MTIGTIAGIWAILYTLIEAIVLFFVETMFPVCEIDILPSFNPKTMLETEYGD